ncbi:hypothetical protein HX004_08365 [Myroides sp. 1354]|uniref:hypothetical protein n=1 Tax=unclassified Myroides TaxID=2642485 RepID=UPI002578EABC|nr:MULTISPECIES: hypothetical protein [unclassified Myroides]MDM1046610.1 hypothetical protein [Myroides sp. R163-1]MDM1055786.1 hypothetical protein [Myroides sp. 1354]MDM1069967.1 hypothetical protein [Myroides sp. 1372]
MKKIYILIIAFFYAIACFSQMKGKINLAGTKWECKIEKDCVNVYKFLTDTTFEFYSCEMEETYYGEYYFENNFLMIYEKGSYEPSDYYEQKLFKVCIKDNYLQRLSLSYMEKGKWVKSKFVFDDTYKYMKVK